MRIRKRFYHMVFILMGLFWVVGIPSAHAVDELFLTGVVKSIDYVSGVITIDVKSESCLGIRSFQVDHTGKLDKDLIGKQISFPIDSSTCVGGRIPKMIQREGGR